MDGNASAQSPAGFLEYLDGLLSWMDGGATGGDPVGRIRSLIRTGRPMVLAVDNFDDLSRMEHWIREDVIGRLPAEGALVLLAALRPPAPAWSIDPVWRTRLISIPMAPLTRAESLEFLSRLGVEESDDLVRQAAGHPLALALAASLAGRPGAPDAVTATAISAHLLREVTAPELQPLVESLTVLAASDQDLLASVSGQQVDPTSYHRLARLSFVTYTTGGLALHEVAREHLLADLRKRAPDRFRTLRQRALSVLRTRLKASTSKVERHQTASALLALCRDALPTLEGYADMTSSPAALSITPLQQDDRPYLLQLVPSQHSADLRLLELLLDRFPQSVRVVRCHEGKPVAFHAMVLLHEETVELLRQHPMGALYLENCPREELAVLNRPHQQADTYYLCLAGHARNHPLYKPHELTTAAYYDLLTVLGEGARLLYVTADPVAIAFMRLLGGRILPDYASRLPGARTPTEVLELDLRQRDVGEWVSRFLGAVDELTPAPAANRTQPPPVDASAAIDLRNALALLRKPARLEGCGLAARLCISGKDLHQRLMALLTEPTPKLSETDQEVLQATYLEKEATAEEVAARLHLSRSTYYRKLGTALANLAEALGST
ncbi:MAG: hypothetical protein ACOY93_23450 [Bacillota bacterium]